MKKLFATICMFVLAAALLGTSTFAWFSMNKTVDATGMKVKATASQSLVISSTLPVGTSTSVSLTAGTSALIPTVHDATYATYTTGLKYVSEGVVDASTGAVSGATYADAINVTGADYYIDYVVYIAAAGGAMSNQNLTVKFDDTTVSAIKALYGLRDTQSAVSVDFYCETINAKGATLTYGTSTFKGTLHCDHTGAEGSITLLSAGNIPQNTSNEAFLVITMRAYVDGELCADYVKTADTALVDGKTYYTLANGVFTAVASGDLNVENIGTYYEVATGLRYVHTNKVNTGDFAFGVKFETASAS